MYLFNTYYVPGTILSSNNGQEHEEGQDPCSYWAYIPVEENRHKQGHS